MTDDALVWGLIGIAAGLIAFAVVVHEIAVARRNRDGVRWIEDHAGHDERRTSAQLWPSEGRSAMAVPADKSPGTVGTVRGATTRRNP